MQIANTLPELIGNTPLLRLERFAPGAGVLAKLESFNPLSSAKDRAALAMLDAADLAERAKKLLCDPKDTEGLVVYSGTVASLFKADYSPYFETELEDPILGRRLGNVYEMTCKSSWYKGN